MKLGLIAVLVFVAVGEGVTDRTRELIGSGNYSAVITELEEDRRSDPHAFEAADKDYLLGRLAARDGRAAKAMAAYTRVVERGSALAPFALAHMSRLAAATGNLLHERVYLERLRLEYPDNVMARAVNDRLSRNALSAGDPQLAISVLTDARPRSAKNDTSTERERTAMLGQAYAMAGNASLARRAFMSVLNSTSNPSQPDNAALIAVRGLDGLDAADVRAGKPLAELAVVDRMQRAAVYQFFRDFAAARVHYGIVAQATGTAASATAALQIGRGLVQTGDHEGSLRWFAAASEYPDSVEAKDAMLASAAAESRLGNTQNAIAQYQAYIDRYPTDERVDRAYFNIIDVLRDAGDDQGALDRCSKAATVFKGKPAEAVAIFTTARIYMARGEWQNALDRLDQLKAFKDLGTAIPGGTNAVEVAALRTLMLEKLGNQATDRRTADVPPAGVAAPKSYIPKLPDQTTWRPDPIAEKLVALKLFDDAAIQIAADATAPPDQLATYALKGDQAYRTLAYIEPLWRNVPKDLPVDRMPRHQAEMLYPVAYRDQLLRAARPRGIDPRLLLAIMRQESRFQPDANSNAAARGLMQFISTTADRIAASLGGTIDAEDLYDPATNILLGAQYTAELFKLFPDQPEAVVGSYNAGEDNVVRWIKRSRSDSPARYVPELMYTQTKDYVYKVMSNYRVYCYLYDEELRAK